MTDLTNILGIALIGVGAASAVYGTILCYSVKVLQLILILWKLIVWKKSLVWKNFQLGAIHI